MIISMLGLTEKTGSWILGARSVSERHQGNIELHTGSNIKMTQALKNKTRKIARNIGNETKSL